MDIQGGRFLIAGGASQVGFHITDELLAGGAAQVLLLDNFSLGSPAGIAHLESDDRVRLIRGNILRLNELLDAMEGIDGVFLVAAYLTDPLSKNPWVGLDVNVRGPQNVLEASRVRGVRKVVFSSSVAVYGRRSDDEVAEDNPFAFTGISPAVGLYGASKIMGEQLGYLYHQRHGLDFVALRYSSVYGPRQHTRAPNVMPIVEMYEQIRAGRRPVISGDGTQVYDHVYVGDVARANVDAMCSDVSGEAFNIATGQAHSLNEIARTLLSVSGSDLEPEYRAQAGASLVPTSTRLAFSREKAERVLGWTPEIYLEEGIRRYIAWREALPGEPS
jgi:UDP-glucose 4-epimerase